MATFSVGEREILRAHEGRKGDVIFLAHSGGLDERSRSLVIFPVAGIVPVAGQEYLVEITRVMDRACQCRVICGKAEFLQMENDAKADRIAANEAAAKNRISANEEKAARFKATQEYKTLVARFENAGRKGSGYVISLISKPWLAETPADFAINLDADWPK